MREWEPLWRAMVPIDEIFEVVVDSAFVGMRKPDPEIYELDAARSLELPPAEACLFVDDLERNCDAARGGRDARRRVPRRRAGDRGDCRGGGCDGAA